MTHYQAYVLIKLLLLKKSTTDVNVFYQRRLCDKRGEIKLFTKLKLDEIISNKEQYFEILSGSTV